jgi:hypothetical protein
VVKRTIAREGLMRVCLRHICNTRVYCGKQLTDVGSLCRCFGSSGWRDAYVWVCPLSSH